LESGAVVDYRDWHVPLGRRFRALKLCFVIHHYGVEGLRRHIRGHVALGRRLTDRVALAADWELAAPAPLNLVCLRHVGDDAATQAVLKRVNASGQAYLTHTRLDGRFTLRVAVGAPSTTAGDVDALWRLLGRTAAAVLAERAPAGGWKPAG